MRVSHAFYLYAGSGITRSTAGRLRGKRRFRRMIVPDGYEVFFDIASTPYNPPWPALAVGAFGSLAAAYIAVAMRYSRAIRILVAIGACLGVAQTAATALTHWNEYRALRSADVQGNYETLESRVQDFHADPGDGDGPQTFSVSGQRFVMTSSDITAGYNRTVSRGGPDLTDKCVRVSFARNDHTGRDQIIWLGVRRSGCADEAGQGA